MLAKKAVTLIEILLVVTLSALLMAAIIPFIRSVNDSWNVSSSRTEILQNGRAALETMTRYIRQARRITKIPGTSGNYIRIRDPQDTYNIVFYHNVSGASSWTYIAETQPPIKTKDLVMQSDSSGTYVDSLLASSLDSLTFIFFQDNGTPATKANDVKSVQIRMVLSDPLGSTTYTLALESTITWRKEVKESIWAINDGDDKLTDIAYETVVSGFTITNVASNCLSANPEDFSCWVADRTGNATAYVKKVSSAGQVEWTLTGFNRPRAVSVNSVLLENGRETIWVADTGGNCIRRIYWTGATWTYATITTVAGTTFSSPSSVSVNPYETVTGKETCWVADTGRNRICRIYWTTAGSGSWTSDTNNIATGFTSPRSVSVNHNEIINGRNTCWVADGTTNATYRVRKIYRNAADTAYTYSTLSMGAGSAPRCVSVNTNDGTCWVANSGTGANGNRVRKISADASTTLVDKAGFSTPYSVSVNPADDTCWVADYNNNRVVRLDASGNVEWSISGFTQPMAVSVRP